LTRREPPELRETEASNRGLDERADLHPWRAAVWLTLLLIGIGMVYTMLQWPPWRLPHEWAPPGDIWHPMVAAHAVARGHPGHMYRPDDFYVAMPLFATLLAPVAAVGQALHLTESYPRVVAHPTLWLVYGPYGLAMSLPLLYAVRALATEAGIRRRRLILQVLVGLLAIASISVVYGHYEDVLALAFVMLAAREALRGRSLAGALWLGLAIAVKQWALLALPVYLALAPPGRRLRALGAGVALPAGLALFTLAVDWPHASKALFQARTFPQVGHAALWVSGQTQVLVGTPSRAGAFVVGFAVAWRLWGRPEPGPVLAGFGLTFLSRLAFEPTLYSYYLGPALAFLLLHEWLRTGRPWRTLVAGGGWLLWFETNPWPWLWWAVSAALALVLAVPAVRELVTYRREPSAVAGTG
jgi:hypothetical protein